MAMLAPSDGMSYQQRSEFERLKIADVSQGKRIADQIATIAALRAALVEACDMLMMQPERRAELQVLGWSEGSRIAELRKLAGDSHDDGAHPDEAHCQRLRKWMDERLALCKIEATSIYEVAVACAHSEIDTLTDVMLILDGRDPKNERRW